MRKQLKSMYVNFKMKEMELLARLYQKFNRTRAVGNALLTDRVQYDIRQCYENMTPWPVIPFTKAHKKNAFYLEFFINSLKEETIKQQLNKQ